MIYLNNYKLFTLHYNKKILRCIWQACYPTYLKTTYFSEPSPIIKKMLILWNHFQYPCYILNLPIYIDKIIISSSPYNSFTQLSKIDFYNFGYWLVSRLTTFQYRHYTWRGELSTILFTGVTVAKIYSKYVFSIPKYSFNYRI